MVDPSVDADAPPRLSGPIRLRRGRGTRHGYRCQDPRCGPARGDRRWPDPLGVGVDL